MEITEGYIYVLINPALDKDYLKIGMTRRTPEIRAKELSKGTGIPADFHVAYELLVPDYEIAEKIVHQKLDQFRPNNNREFFVLPLKKAIAMLDEILSQTSFEVGEKLLYETDRILASLNKLEYQVPPEMMAHLISTYSKIAKYCGENVGLTFRAALVALVFSRRVEKDLPIRAVAANFSEINFGKVIAATSDNACADAVGTTLYYFPYHAYINRVIALMALDRYKDAKQLCNVMEVRLNDTYLENDKRLQEVLSEQCSEVRKLVDSYMTA